MSRTVFIDLAAISAATLGGGPLQNLVSLIDLAAVPGGGPDSFAPYLYMTCAKPVRSGLNSYLVRQ
jgi:hypothetical protein